MSFEFADGLRYLFLDFNAYFAAVEQHDDPALLGQPVIVAPSASEHTASTCSVSRPRPQNWPR